MTNEKIVEKAQEKIAHIKEQNEIVGSSLLEWSFPLLISTRRTNAYYKFIVDHSESELIQIVTELNRDYPDIEERWNPILKTFGIEPTILDGIKKRVWEFRHKPKPEAMTMLKISLEMLKNSDDRLNSFLGYLLNNHPEEWKSFSRKTPKHYNEDKNSTLITLQRGFDLGSDEERRVYFKQKGFI